MVCGLTSKGCIAGSRFRGMRATLDPGAWCDEVDLLSALIFCRTQLTVIPPSKSRNIPFLMFNSYHRQLSRGRMEFLWDQNIPRGSPVSWSTRLDFRTAHTNLRLCKYRHPHRTTTDCSTNEKQRRWSVSLSHYFYYYRRTRLEWGFSSRFVRLLSVEVAQRILSCI